MRSTIVQAIVSVFLIGVFCVPIVVPAIHTALEDHEHTSCDVSDGIHQHEEESDCSICDYLIGIQSFHKDDEEEHVLMPTVVLTAISKQGEFSKGQLHSTSVRGPPVIS